MSAMCWYLSICL